ncbi:response regulator [Patulibacter sp. NPDC049589]|uniref:response regulator n=1 Tax=Patulibacter sp. NPDC049589 TaxID=3154731 RepID=UPI0034311D92
MVEDMLDARKVVTDRLRRAGHDVVGEASGPADAVAHYRVLRPDVCAIDVAMEDLAGVAAMRRIMEVDPDARVIACTRAGEDVNVIAAIRSGARDVVATMLRLEHAMEEIDHELHGTGPPSRRRALPA